MGLEADFKLDRAEAAIPASGAAEDQEGQNIAQDIAKLKQEAKQCSRGFRASMILAGLVTVAAVALKILCVVGAVALSLTPFGWAALGLVTLALVFILVRRRLEGKIEGHNSHVAEEFDANASMIKEIKKGFFLLFPVFGWIKVIREESSQLPCTVVPESSSSSSSSSPVPSDDDDVVVGEGNSPARPPTPPKAADSNDSHLAL